MSKIVKGTLDSIPADLVKVRHAYEWDKLEPGDHAVFNTSEYNETEFGSIRSAATNYFKGSKTRKPGNIATRTVEIKDSENKVVGKQLEVWRLADEVVTAAAEASPTPANNNEAKKTK